MSGAAEGIAGLALSAVSVAALFTSCIDCFNIVAASTNFGRDYELQCTALAIQKLRLFLWGESVGLTSRNASQTNHHHPGLDDPLITPVLLRTLKSIKHLLVETRSFNERYDLQCPDGLVQRRSRGLNIFRSSFEEFEMAVHRNQKQKSVKTVARWAIHDSDKFEGIIKHLRGFVDGLQDITGSLGVFSDQQARLQEEIESVPDTESLQLICDAAGQEDVADVARQRLQQRSVAPVMLTLPTSSDNARSPVQGEGNAALTSSAKTSPLRFNTNLTGLEVRPQDQESPFVERHQCPDCLMDFTTHDNLKSHILTHTAERPLHCETDDPRFRRLYHFNPHTKGHSGERPFVCRKCGRSFARDATLTQHWKAVCGSISRRAVAGDGGAIKTDDQHESIGDWLDSTLPEPRPEVLRTSSTNAPRQEVPQKPSSVKSSTDLSGGNAAYASSGDDDGVPLADFACKVPKTVSTRENFSLLFPSNETLFFNHDEEAADGNMTLCVSTTTEQGRGSPALLFYLKIEEIQNRNFSLRRFHRKSGREICHTTRVYRRQVRKRTRVHRSISNSITSIHSMSSGRRSSRSSQSGAESATYHSDSIANETLSSHTTSSPEPSNQIRMVFSNYSSIDLSRIGPPRTTRYEFDYWGCRYWWKRKQKDGPLGKLISYSLYKKPGNRVVAHIAVQGMDEPWQGADRPHGYWIPRARMRITDREILCYQGCGSDVPDLVVATGVVAFVDDCIIEWNKKKTWDFNDCKLTTARNHPLYKAISTVDGMYHCPFVDSERCLHNPDKLKCNYDRHLDSHLKPYRCTNLACANLHFASTAVLLKHEREAHGEHSHDNSPYMCLTGACKRSVPGNGFPRWWDLWDYMKSLRNYNIRDF